MKRIPGRRFEVGATVLPVAVIASLLFPGQASAAEEPGEAACKEFLAEVKSKDCPPPDTAAKDAPSAPAEAAPIAPVEVSPFKDWCGQPLDELGCSDLASLLGMSKGMKLADKAPAKPSKAASTLLADAQQNKVQDRQTANNKSGSLAQVEPVEAIQPISLAGGALSIAGTRTGTQGVATITVNPLALANLPGATAGRVFDLSVIAPFDFGGSTQNTVRFVGARARINLTAGYSAERLNKALVAYGAAAGKHADDLEQVLREATNLRQCATVIMKTGRVTAEACGKTLEDVELQRLTGEAYTELGQARRDADRYYLGLDLRLDRGDPTGPSVLGDDGTRVNGAVAAGIRISQGADWDFELRGRAGIDYFRSRDDVAGVKPDPVVSGTWGAAVILSGHPTKQIVKQRMGFGVGLEGRHAGKSDSADLVPTNFINLNLMAIVPAASGGDLGLAASIPLDDAAVPRGTIVTLSTDFGLLDGSGPKRAP